MASKGNFSKSWGISSRLSPIGMQIALEKPPGEISLQVRSKSDRHY